MSIKAQNKNKISYPYLHAPRLSRCFLFLLRYYAHDISAVYCLHVFTLTAGYHRYFSRKSFKTSRLFQFILAFLGTSWRRRKIPYGGLAITDFTMNMPTAKMTPLARHGGFWWAHIGWVMQRKLDETRYDKIKDFT